MPLSGWQAEEKSTSLPRVAFRPDASFVSFDGVAGDGQSQSGAPTGARLVSFVETFEDPRQIFWLNSDSGVMY